MMRRLSLFPLPSTTRRATSAGIVLICALLGACAGPSGRPATPPVAIPAQWQAGPAGAGADDAVLAHWWRQFDDALLDELVNDALAANLDLASAQAQLRQARAQRDAADAQLGPSLNASLSSSRVSTSALAFSQTHSQASAGFDASWEADVFGRARSGARAAQADLRTAVERLRDAQVSVAAEVALNYVDLRTTEQRVAIAEANLRARRATSELAQWRRDAGLVTELDVVQARTELDAARAALPALQTARSQAQHRLAVLTGRAPGDLATRLATSAPVPQDRAIAIGIPADTLRRRPDVRAAARRLDAQRARLDQAEAARYPSLRLSGTIMAEAIGIGALGDSGSPARTLLAAITAPVFDAGRLRAAIVQQDALLDQARVAYQAAVMKALEEVENALAASANAAQRHAELGRAVASAREAVQIAEHRYASGLIDFLAVLDSQRTLLTLEDQLAVSAGDVARARVQLYKALGGGWSAAPLDSPEKEPT